MSTLSPELQHKQMLSVSNIYTRSKNEFEPGIPTMAYKTPLPSYQTVTPKITTFESQFPSKGGAIPCEDYYTAGAEPAQWCQPWGGECPLGRRVVPSRRADPVMVRGDVPVPILKRPEQGTKIPFICLFVAIVLFFILFNYIK